MGSWVIVALLAGVPAVLGDDSVDLALVHAIKQEAFRNSKVMDHLFYLSDVCGPRLTASPGHRAAAEWSVQALKGFGVEKAGLENWGPFGQGWTLTRFQMALAEPSYAPLTGVVKAWSPGTDGLVKGQVVIAPLLAAKDQADRFNIDKLNAAIQEYKETWAGKLRGKVVLCEPPRELSLPTKPGAERYDDRALEEMAAAPEPSASKVVKGPIRSAPADFAARFRFFQNRSEEETEEFFNLLGETRRAFLRLLHEEGALAALFTDPRGDGAITFSEAAGSYKGGGPAIAPTVVLPPESYNRLYRLADKNIPTSVELEIAVRFDPPSDGFNVVGEIPGSNPRKRDQIVMVGGHLDSWHGGTGATDNAAGSAVALEVMRILKTLGKPMDRSVRIALWSGEEQGLLGSKGYVKAHFADPKTMALREEHAKLSGYFNLDYGSGRVRGVYLQENEMMRPIFEAWLAPFKDLGVRTITIQNIGGTDHASFDDVGLPAFQFIQDPLDYFTRTHHSNLDTYDHVVASDLMQAAAVISTCVYEAATRGDMLPRKPLPKPTSPARVP